MSLDQRSRAAAQALQQARGQLGPAPPLRQLQRRQQRRALRTVAVTVVVLLAAAALLIDQLAAHPSRVVAPRPLGRIVATVGVGKSPTDVVAALDGSAVWVANRDDGTLSRIDPASNRVTATLRLGHPPDGLAVAYGSVWVAYADWDRVSRIDPAANRVVREIGVGRHGNVVHPGPPFREYLGVGHGALWVPNNAAGTVSRIDPATNMVRATIDLGGSSTSLGVAVAGDAVWVADAYRGALRRIDPVSNRVTRTVALGQNPSPIQGDAGGLWVTELSGHTLYRLDPRSGRRLSTVVLGPDPTEIVDIARTPALLATGDAVWATTVTAGGVRALVRVDPHALRLLGAMPLPGRVDGLAAADGDLWLTSYETNTVLRLTPTP
jgi:YVTN family beta-propeller protein